MTQDAQLKQGVEALGLPIEQNLDTTAAGEYVVYSYRRQGALYGDDGPCLEQRQWEVVYAAPVGQNRLKTRMAIIDLIQQLFGVYPSEEDVSDVSNQRYLYEFETIGGVSNGDNSDQ